ncbi:MAG: UvrD-helicase domain-containing protein [Anaerolineae bacterium]|nr:UvrD-helicase domain-containing protein [Anaerolineae bacterium]
MGVTDILKGLNPQQQAAVSAGDGPVLVLAGPGSGKTRVLTHRIAYLVEARDVRAWHIMAVTFTNKAAREMENRVTGLLSGSGQLDGLAIGTFHANCARILRVEAEATAYTRDYVIFDTDDQLKVLTQVLADLNLDPKKNTPRAMLNKISAAKNELITPEQYMPDDYSAEKVRRAYLRYEELLRQNNARDFDDLLVHTVRLFQDRPDVLERYLNRYWHILVDEFQDTNMAQYTLVRLLAGERRNLFAVGDPDQSIYAFRGADYRNVQRFREDYPDTDVILLEENYRSHQAILDAATGVIDQNTDRQPKELFSQRKVGPLVRIYEGYNEDDEARFVVETIADLINRKDYDPGDFAIMYRTNAQSRAIEEGFLRAGMPYRLIGATRFYARKEIKDVLAYLRFIHNPDENISMQRIINVPTRGIGLKTLETLDTWGTTMGLTPPHALLALLDENVEAPFSTRARNSLTGFAGLVEEWRALKDQLSPDELITRVLNDTGYLSYLDDGTQQGESRIENVLELRGVAETYAGLPLSTFLEEVSLVSDVDMRDDETAAPSLLTLHSAKGLEYPVVFIVGMEENILPHSRSIAPERNPNATSDQRQQAAKDVEEERRLFYVGITRAEERLYLCYATIRSLYGDSRANLPSRFLYDIPEEVRQGSPLRKPGSSADTDAYRQMTTWSTRTAVFGRPNATRRESRGGSQPKREKQATQFKGGDCVWHAKYGEGVVVSSSLASGDMEQVDVLFPGDVGQKTIIADFLKKMDS